MSAARYRRQFLHFASVSTAADLWRGSSIGGRMGRLSGFVSIPIRKGLDRGPLTRGLSSSETTRPRTPSDTSKIPIAQEPAKTVSRTTCVKPFSDCGSRQAGYGAAGRELDNQSIETPSGARDGAVYPEQSRIFPLCVCGPIFADARPRRRPLYHKEGKDLSMQLEATQPYDRIKHLKICQPFLRQGPLRLCARVSARLKAASRTTVST